MDGLRFAALSLLAVLLLCQQASGMPRQVPARHPPELEFLPEIVAAIERGEFGDSAQDRRQALTGAVNFFSPFPGGNGRACATCHNPQDGYSLSPRTVETRWRKLQAARRPVANSAARTVAAALDIGLTAFDVDPPLTPLERHGKERFDFFCGRCHGGPAQVDNRENRIFPPHDGSTNPVSINVGVSNPLPAGLTSKIHGAGFDLSTQGFVIDLPMTKA